MCVCVCPDSFSVGLVHVIKVIHVHIQLSAYEIETLRTASTISMDSDLRFIMRVCFDYVRWRHRNHTNTITSAIAAKQTVSTVHNKHCRK